MDCSSPPSFGWSVNIVPGFVIRYSEYRMGLFAHIFHVERDDLKSTILGRRSSASDQTAFQTTCKAGLSLLVGIPVFKPSKTTAGNLRVREFKMKRSALGFLFLFFYFSGGYSFSSSSRKLVIFARKGTVSTTEASLLLRNHTLYLGYLGDWLFQSLFIPVTTASHGSNGGLGEVAEPSAHRCFVI